MDDNVLLKHTSERLMGYILKHIYDQDLMPHILKIKDSLQELHHSKRRHLVKYVLRYIMVKGEFKDKSALNQFVNSVVSKKLGESIMGLGEQLWLEGRQEGRQEIARNLLESGAKIDYVASVTNLSVDFINEMLLRECARS